MIEIIGKIAVLLGINRDGRGFEKRRRKPGRVRRESDSVTISTEARQRLAHGGDEGTAADEEIMK